MIWAGTLGYNLDHVHIMIWAGTSMKFGKKFENVHVLNLHFFKLTCGFEEFVVSGGGGGGVSHNVLPEWLM